MTGSADNQTEKNRGWRGLLLAVPLALVLAGALIAGAALLRSEASPTAGQRVQSADSAADSAANCPTAAHEHYTRPTTITATGPALVHSWWTNGQPTWGQQQVRVVLAPDETITFTDIMGRVYTYENIPACETLLQQFEEAAFPVVTVEDLLAQGLVAAE